MQHTANGVVVKTALPGVKPEEVDITITGDTLPIKGETKAEEEALWAGFLQKKGGQLRREKPKEFIKRYRQKLFELRTVCFRVRTVCYNITKNQMTGWAFAN